MYRAGPGAPATPCHASHPRNRSGPDTTTAAPPQSVAGQAKARTGGRFPGRRPSLSEQQREYIRVERSKGVSQREPAKQLEVSRWTIQQVDG